MSPRVILLCTHFSSTRNTRHSQTRCSTRRLPAYSTISPFVLALPPPCPALSNTPSRTISPARHNSVAGINKSIHLLHTIYRLHQYIYIYSTPTAQRSSVL